MDPAIYKFIHFVGIFVLLTGLGAFCFAKDHGPNKLAGMAHGVGFLLVLLGGFGMAKHEAISFTWWFIVKAVILLALGAMLVVIKRKMVPPPVAWLIVIILASGAAWLGFANSVILRP